MDICGVSPMHNVQGWHARWKHGITHFSGLRHGQDHDAVSMAGCGGLVMVLLCDSNEQSTVRALACRSWRSVY